MKNFTLLSSLALVSLMPASMHAQDAMKTFTWIGWQTVGVENPDYTWSTSVANWLDKDMADLGLEIPSEFEEGAIAVFNDKFEESAAKANITAANGMNVGELQVIANKNFQITGTSLIGSGNFIKSGDGTVVFGAKNQMTGVTYMNGGRIETSSYDGDALTDSVVFNDGTIRFGTLKNSNYPNPTMPIYVPEGKVADIELSRYAYFQSPLYGKGDVVIRSMGERSYIGHKNAAPDYSNFEGRIFIEKCTEDGVTPGFYGAILKGTAAYNDETGEGLTPTFKNLRLHIGSGAVIASESKDYCYEIGELTSEDETSKLYGYYKKSNPSTSYMIGGLGTDVVFPGQITPYYNGDTPNRDMKVTIYKVGDGTYTLTYPYNCISGGLFVREGKVFISNNDGEIVGTQGIKGDGTSFYVQGGVLGGNGRLCAGLEVQSGTLAPGEDGIGTLTLGGLYYPATDTYGSQKAGVTFFPGSVGEFEIKSAESYDKLISNSVVRFDVAEDGTKSTIKVVLTTSHDIKDGEEFVIIEALQKYEGSEYNIELPEVDGLTLTVVESVVEATEETPASYKLIVKANGTSTDASLIGSDKVVVYPIAKDYIAIEGNLSKVEVLNNSGAVVMVGCSNEVYVQGLQSGVYFVRVYGESGTTVHRVIKK